MRSYPLSYLVGNPVLDEIEISHEAREFGGTSVTPEGPDCEACPLCDDQMDAETEAAWVAFMESTHAAPAATPPARYSARAARMAAAAALADEAVALARGAGAYVALTPSERAEQLEALGVAARDTRAGAIADRIQDCGVGGISDQDLIDFIADPFPISRELPADVLIERASAELVKRLGLTGGKLAA